MFNNLIYTNMKNTRKLCLVIIGILNLNISVFAQTITNTDTLVLKDITNEDGVPASMMELNIPSNGYKLQGFIYKATGKGYHPTVFLLHGFPGNERNLDLAQVLRSRGWNVIYFNYRGAWGGQGQFSFKSCVDDVVNVVHYAEKEKDKLQVDVNNMALFGHSMGGWVTLKSIQLLPEIKKAFALSTWDIAATFKDIKNETELIKYPKADFNHVFVLNAPYKKIFLPVIQDRVYYDIANDAKKIAEKKVVMLDEHKSNAHIAEAIQKVNSKAVEYLQWDTDHSFSTKRVSLIKKVCAFLEVK